MRAVYVEEMRRFSKIFKKYRKERNRKKLLKNSSYFIDQLGSTAAAAESGGRRDTKEIFFYPTVFDTSSDIKLNKLLLILSSDNFFLCNGETATTDNKKVIEYCHARVTGVRLGLDKGRLELWPEPRNTGIHVR